MKLNKNFLKNFKKNDIVIYAIALMLVTAGYFNYTANLGDESIETYSEDINEVLEMADENNTSSSDENIGDAELVNSNDVITESDDEVNSDDMLSENVEEMEDLADVENEQSDDLADAESGLDVTNSEDISASSESDSSDYFVSTKLERDTNYASMISTYTRILEDESVSETQKSIAMTEITNINDTKNAISICENLLSTKGFTNSVILVNNDSVNVVVEVDGGLTSDKVAQIQNIISREFGSEIDDIHISEKE